MATSSATSTMAKLKYIVLGSNTSENIQWHHDHIMILTHFPITAPFVREIHQWPLDYLQKGPGMWEMKWNAGFEAIFVTNKVKLGQALPESLKWMCETLLSWTRAQLNWCPCKRQSGALPTVYPKKYAHGFVVLCFVVVMQSFIMNSHEVFIHIQQGCFAGTGAIVRLPQCQWSKPDGYKKISQCITTTKHSKAKTVCIFLGIYCR